MNNPYDKIIKLLEDRNVGYDISEHDPVYTSEQASRARGESMDKGAKSLLIKTEGDFVLAVLPGSKQLDSRKLRDFLGVKKMRFATPEEVKEVMGCEIGACYPIGSVAGIKTIVDNSLSDNDSICLNPGVHNKTIEIKWMDYELVADFEMSDISK
jgi:Ala-tRNA(Pro) deacylase